MRKFPSSLSVVVTFLVAALAAPAFAGPARQLSPQVERVLKHFPVEGKATVRDLALGRESLDTIELEPMQVWAKDAKITVYGAPGQETVIPVPDVKYFKGRVVGESDSAVFFSRSANGEVRGMVVIGERRWIVGTGVRKGVRPNPNVRKNIDDRGLDADAPVLISEIDAIDELNDTSEAWSCDIGQDASALRLRIPGISTEAQKTPAAEAGNVAGATYQLRIAIETDNEFCAAFGNDATAITTYIGDLIGKASIVYSRDIKTTLILGDTHIRNGGAGTDPWVGTNSSTSLAEFGTVWHNNFSLGYPDPDGGGPAGAGGGVAVQRSSAVFLSGRLFSAGIAWVNVLCETNFFCGTTGASCGSATFANSYAGAYAFNSSSGSVTTTVPDPTATVNGIEFGIPNSSSFWMLLEMMHELGHNVASPHSSCVALTPAEQATYGVTPRAFVDLCLSGGTGCFSGTEAAPAERGTIMSYCHNKTISGFRASRYLFGKAGEPSEKMLPILNGGLEGCTADGTITIQAEPVACAAGRTASVPACGSCTFGWQITGGTITSATNTSSITYTPTQANVTLTATVITSNGCGITTSKAVVASCVPVLPPTNVVATATSTSNVFVSWTASAGAASYNVYRSPDAINYTFAGNSATTNFNDGGRTANTAYLYKVRAVNGGESADSNKDLATTTVFTTDPLVASSTTVQAVHITQLRTAVDAVRMLAGIGGGTYTDPTITAGATQIKAAHVTDLRSALNDALTALSFSAVSFAEGLTAGTTKVKASHITELRGGVQ